ncbi:hypothetical protein RZN22_05485 [Bacillaceae bacterium S4-13-58]
MNKWKTITVILILGFVIFFATQERNEEDSHDLFLEISEEDNVEMLNGHMYHDWEAPKDFKTESKNGKELQLIFGETKKEIESYVEKTKQFEEINDDAISLMKNHHERMNVLWNSLYELEPGESSRENQFIIETSFWYENYVNTIQSLFSLFENVESKEDLLKMGIFPEEFNSIDGILRYPFRFAAQRYNELISRFYNQFEQSQQAGAMRVN